MPVERSAGAVIYRETKKGREYLLLHHPDSRRNGKLMPSDARRSREAGRSVSGHWDFPKGHVEKGERTEETVRREVREESGIRSMDFVPGFKETIRYFVKIGEERRLKFVAFFLARTREKKVKISFEHQGYAWLPYEQAYARATYAGAKQVLKKADQFLAGNPVP